MRKLFNAKFSNNQLISKTFMQNSSPIQTIYHPLFQQHNIEVQIKRDDLIDPVISGNKWRKLKYNVEHVKEIGFEGILSFGGGYSNHIHALSYLCKQQNLKAVGIIRGEPHYQNNCTLSQAKQWGMSLKFVNRSTYRLRNESEYLQQLQDQYPNHLIVPEGGSNALALQGVAEICHELKQQTEYDTLITPVGSAGTITGLIHGDMNQHNILGIAVLKQQDYLKNEVVELLNQVTHTSSDLATNWDILSQFHGGGYAKFSQKDLQQLSEFIHMTNIPFEPIYSGKMILALLDLVSQGFFKPKHRIVLLHTGGLQGIAGLIEQNKLKADEWPLPPELQAL